MNITEYLNLPKTRIRPQYEGQIYCPSSIKKSNPKVGDKVHYMEITKYTDGEMPETTIQLTWTILEENPGNDRFQKLLHDLATADFKRIVSY